MSKAGDLKRIARQVLGGGPGPDFFFRVDRMLEEADVTNAALLSATKKIESMVRFYISAENADVLAEKFREYLKNNASYL